MFLLSFLVISVGIASLIGFVGHIFFADRVAIDIGEATASPFQQEVGFANLAIGILGITCIWLRGNYWVATVIAATTFLWGAAYGHILDIIVHGNYTPGNAGGALFNDTLVPLITIALLAAYKGLQGQSKKAHNFFFANGAKEPTTFRNVSFKLPARFYSQFISL